jgi:dihydroorotate dehydrogenase electron transfer subunit
LRGVFATILQNRAVAEDILKMVLRGKDGAGLAGARPGQFLMVRCSDTSDPLLRRPMSLYDVSGDTFSIVYRVVGAGTRLMAKMPEGGEVHVIAPLGNGFNLPPQSGRVALVGRGVGAAPLVFLAKTAIAQGKRVFGFISATSRESLVGVEDLSKMGVELQTGVDTDGSSTELLDLIRERHSAEPFDYVATCGSRRMLRLVQDLRTATGVPGEVLLETRMACGIGVCKGCVVMTADGTYKKVCTDGPVFPVELIAG